MNQSPWQLPDSFFESLGNQNWAVADSALELSAAETLRKKCIESSIFFESAGIGRIQQDKSIRIENTVRSDKIKWLDETDIAWPIANALKEILKSTMRIHLLDFEAHFTAYPPGSSYELHIDQFADYKNLTLNHSALVPKRTFSFILYLNQAWKPGDGGELMIFSKEENLEKKVEPIFNRLVVFQSAQVPHSVLVTQKPRYSLTGWIRK